MGKYLVDFTGINFNNMLEIYNLTAEFDNLPKIGFIHDGSSHYGKKSLRYDELDKYKNRYKRSKVIFLVRDPRDVLISYYMECTKRAIVYPDNPDKTPFYMGNISSFLRDDRFGLMKIISFYNIWEENKSVPKDFLLLRYEDMRKNVHEHFRKVLKFCGIPIDDNILDSVVEFSKFENMQKMERENALNTARLRPGNVNDPDTYKVRKGEVGGYKSYFSNNDIDYLNRTIDENLSDYFGYNYREH
jgi:hypothetical protein